MEKISCTSNEILNQTYQNFEFIIIDDCSTDNSSHILQNMQKKDSRIKIIKKKKYRDKRFYRKSKPRNFYRQEIYCKNGCR